MTARDGAGPNDKFARLAELKADWDSYGAVPISPTAIDAARRWLDDVQVVPCSDGGVQLEWHQDGSDVEVEFNPAGSVSSVFAKEGARPALTVERLEAFLSERFECSEGHSGVLRCEYCRNVIATAIVEELLPKLTGAQD